MGETGKGYACPPHSWTGPLNATLCSPFYSYAHPVPLWGVPWPYLQLTPLCGLSGPALRPPGPAHPASALAFRAILLRPALPVNYILVKLIKKKKIFFLQGSNLMTSCKFTGFLSGFLAMTQGPNSITGQGVLWVDCYHTPRR